MKRTWTPEEEDLLIKEYPTATPDRIKELFPNKSRNSIKAKLNGLKLKKKVPKFRFSPEQLEELKRDYANTLNKDLADRFGCSIHTVENKAYDFNLKKNPEFLKSVFRKKMQDPNHPGRKFLIKKGNVPPNKGKKQTEYMSQEAIERSKSTWFKKGHIPQNYKSVGHERVTADGYIEIKVQDPNVFKLKHRIVWEEHFGVIPAGCNIQFKDGNRQNCDIQNLYMISRQKQMVDNSGSNNLPDGMIALYLVGGHGKDKDLIEEIKQNHPDLIELKRNQILLNRKIRSQNGSNEKT